MHGLQKYMPSNAKHVQFISALIDRTKKKNHSSSNFLETRKRILGSKSENSIFHRQPALFKSMKK